MVTGDMQYHIIRDLSLKVYINLKQKLLLIIHQVSDFCTVALKIFKKTLFVVYVGGTRVTEDTHSFDHNTPGNVSLFEESVRDEDFKVESIIDDCGVSVDKADQSSISSHYNSYSRRRHIVSAEKYDKTIDTTSSMYVV